MASQANRTHNVRVYIEAYRKGEDTRAHAPQSALPRDRRAGGEELLRGEVGVTGRKDAVGSRGGACRASLHRRVVRSTRKVFF